jgi:hypothetical protein
MPIPQTYRKSSENVIASYDFFEISDGTGIVEFYCGTNGQTTRTTSSNPQQVFLSGGTIFQNVFYSQRIEDAVTTSGTSDGASYYGVFNLAPFQQPKIIKGRAYFQGSLARNAVGTATGIIYVQLFKASTSGLTAISDSLSGTTFAANTSGADFIEIPINGTHHFQAGEYLRLNFAASVGSGTTGANVYVAFDPMNRDGSIIKPSTNSVATTQMKLWVPFKIDL